MTEEDNSPHPSFGEKLSTTIKSIFRFFLRIVIVILFGILLGGGIYFGLLQREFENVNQIQLSQLDEIKEQQNLVNQKTSQRLESMESRLNVLENQNTADSEKLSELQTRINELEKTLQDQNISLKQLDELQARISNLNKEIDENQQAISKIQEELQNNDTPTAAMRHDLIILKAMELLTRGRIFLTQNNFGLASQDIQSARNILADLYPQVPNYQQTTIASTVARLDQVLSDLPNYPVLATDDLEIAWQSLVNGLPTEPKTEESETLSLLTPLPASPTPGILGTPTPPISTDSTPTRITPDVTPLGFTPTAITP
jgi:chaperonin cofactor prefoldin